MLVCVATDGVVLFLDRRGATYGGGVLMTTGVRGVDVGLCRDGWGGSCSAPSAPSLS